MKARTVQHWGHYWAIANSRKDLKVFKDLLQVNANQPSVDISQWKVPTKDGEKTFKELIDELKPVEKP